MPLPSLERGRGRSRAAQALQPLLKNRMDINKRSILWIVFAVSLVFLWNNWMVSTGKPSMFAPAPAKPAVAAASATAGGVPAAATVAAAAPAAGEAAAPAP